MLQIHTHGLAHPLKGTFTDMGWSRPRHGCYAEEVVQEHPDLELQTISESRRPLPGGGGVVAARANVERVRARSQRAPRAGARSSCWKAKSEDRWACAGLRGIVKLRTESHQGGYSVVRPVIALRFPMFGSRPGEFLDDTDIRNQNA